MHVAYMDKEYVSELIRRLAQAVATAREWEGAIAVDADFLEDVGGELMALSVRCGVLESELADLRALVGRNRA